MQSWRAHVAALFEAAGTSSPKGVSAAGSKPNVVRSSFIEHRDNPRDFPRNAIVATSNASVRIRYVGPPHE